VALVAGERHRAFSAKAREPIDIEVTLTRRLDRSPAE